MIKITAKLMSILMLGLLITSCEKIETTTIPGDTVDFSAKMDGIPLDYGRLVSVTSAAPFIQTLWFEQADQTIVGVRVNVSRSTISKEVIQIERK